MKNSKTMSAELTVRTPTENYPVHIGDTFPGHALKKVLEGVDTSTAFLVIDSNVETLHGDTIRNNLSSTGLMVKTLTIPAGETSKSVDSWRSIVDFLLNNGVRRHTPVIAAGGGMTGDVAGFAAATALRGVPLIHMPTTLLAMVDSSIGGKTGINHPAGKNLIGSFYQPKAVLMDTSFLNTLPNREWSDGLSEILKYGAIKDTAIFPICKTIFFDNRKPADSEKLAGLIKTCVKIKADIVEADEKESGVRAWLNFGHTFAHALEKAAGYGHISHGEAVFVGMLAATHLSVLEGASIKEVPFGTFKPLYSFNPDIFDIPVKTLIKLMYSDKKIITGALRFVLLNEWESPRVTELKTTENVHKSWEFALSEIKKQSATL